MSGGVDSSVAAALLQREGFDVVGCTLHLWDYPDDSDAKSRCCAPEDIHDARRVCDALEIPHYSFDRRELFQKTVVAPFVEAYLQGQTPSPCVQCNRSVKIQELIQIADRLGAQFLATGHYARLLTQEGRVQLHRGRDSKKDQSYFLHMLPQATLRRLRFPLGDLTKEQVRAEAVRLNLHGAHKGESQELCFVPSGRYDAFVADRADGKLRPGPILDEQGRQVGNHEGIHGYTVGQRRNLGVSLGKRAYVLAVDPGTASVHVGERAELEAVGARLRDVTLADGVQLPLSCSVSVRYRGTPVACRVSVPSLDAGAARSAELAFEEPVLAVVPGQVAVLYDGDRVLGGGTITGAVKAPGSRRSLGVAAESSP